jgi:hypothetical protein
MLKTALSAAAGLGLALTLAHPAVAQEDESQGNPVIGQWELSFETRRGSQTMTLTFEMDGETLKGSAETRRGAVDLENVRFEGDQVAFNVPFGRRGGRQGFALRFTGTIDGDTMEGRLRMPRGDNESPWTAQRIST